MAPTELKPLFLQFLLLLMLIWVSRIGAEDTMFNESGHSVVSRNENPKGRCPHGWFISPNKTKCYGFMSVPKSWNESESQCNEYGGNLAALITYQEFSFAQNLCNGTLGGCWVGGRAFNSSNDFVWKWSDNVSKWNDSMFPSSALQSNCKNVSCRANDSVETCTSISGGLATPLLKDEKCNSSHPYICMIDLDGRCHHMQCHKEYLVILAVVSGLIVCTTLAVVVWLLAYKRSKKRRRSRKPSNTAASALVPPSWKVFTKEELRSITKNFSEGNRLLGDTKTGGTYSGLLPDGSRVAIKRLKKSSFQRKKEFHSEIARVAKLRHPNLVALKGCCYDHGDRYIVYEFIVNGPLDRWLYHVPRGGRSLDWTMRMKVATTLAQGIAFLHDKVKPHVVHRDIRASNVLLDEDFGAHLMGVGLSKLVAYEVMHERTVMAGGTYGYLAPEFVYRNELTTKSDVYSFGVLLLEVVTGRRPAQAVDSVGWQSIFEWATPLVQAHRYLDLLDPHITATSTSEIPEAGVVQKVVDLVYACTQHVPSMRPRMSHVVHQLQQLAPSPLTMK
ncbi:C-type lectin receptor-like tyrosine-protein kinase At1g52310 [Cucurbita pepo subsp. pepo]|uniref:C-type lectin receptor-like tyrosine-protein kinase At1g52310 n=1 Tax=Cucurbita pepo subsp. pepo TaxID=3664 RepID=UPI000C9D3EA0|nr:C-type lectin receptor-like tyrosine-protein kinase At1g52310 [Cucurbita pepo subsp. pepo]XP_023542625.1 C-type lectin receptor-like tyrosine-protein kinase At1g52310 [Cucurbita pepo subsp. pepo]